jgi:hypothetical protein
MIHAIFLILLAFQQVQNPYTKTNCTIVGENVVCPPDVTLVPAVQPRPCVTLEVSRPEPKWIDGPCYPPGTMCSSGPQGGSRGSWICPKGWKVEKTNGGWQAWCMEPKN